jgi:hypothetical protein
MATRTSVTAQDLRDILDRAHKAAQYIDGYIRVSYSKNGYRVSLKLNDGSYETGTEIMSRRDAYDELYYLLCE